MNPRQEEIDATALALGRFSVSAIVYVVMAVVSWMGFGSVGGFAHWWGWIIAFVAAIMTVGFLLCALGIAAAVTNILALRSK